MFVFDRENAVIHALMEEHINFDCTITGFKYYYVEYFLNKSFQHHTFTGNAINGLPICYTKQHREEREEVLK